MLCFDDICETAVLRCKYEMSQMRKRKREQQKDL